VCRPLTWCVCVCVCVLLQCVNLGTYEANKVVTFIPPDGEFELMR
jgi:hypothetical protein